MNGKIFKIKDDDELITINEKKHKNENDFQGMISKYPDLIPGDQIDNENPRRWLLVGREIDNIDIFFLDQDGLPTIVEVKKSNNNEIHREVVGQMLDYGSKLVFSQTIETILPKIEKYSPIKLQDFLGNNIDKEGFLKKVKNNLAEENMRLIVVSDEIPINLQNIIEFLNNKIESIDVLALEIKQYTDDTTGTKTLVPRLIGHSRSTIPFEPELSETTFFDNLDDVGVEFYRELINFANENNLQKKWTKTGFFLTVSFEENEIKILHCFSGLYSFGQSIFSTNTSITDEVRGGDEIFERFLNDILELDGFYKVSNGFGFKIEKNLDENQWKEFKRIILETKRKIERSRVEII